jgi:hypothetical protein
MSYQCQYKRCMCVVQEAASTCLSDSSGTYFICTVCMHRTYLPQTEQLALAPQAYDRRTM